jgi:muramoyltetrapeptide carboxypeptidase
MPTPKRLQSGDTIGILSTSSPVEQEAVDRMKEYFEQKGYSVQVAPNTLARFGFMAGTPQVRAEDFNSMLHDPAVRMIVTAMGGTGAEQLLPLIDYEALSSDPKMVVGLSNPAVLLNAITSVTDVPTIHGPNGVEFGYGPLTQFAEENFWPIVGASLPMPHVFPVSDEIKVVRGGSIVEGRLYGGHLRTVELLIGTPWAPKWKDSILFLEEVHLSFCVTDRSLTHFKLAGIFDSIKGLMFGQPVESDPVEAETLEDILLRKCADYDFPIISNVRIGHTDDKITVPIGCRVRLNPIEPSLALLESPTR